MRLQLRHRARVRHHVRSGVRIHFRPRDCDRLRLRFRHCIRPGFLNVMHRSLICAM